MKTRPDPWRRPALAGLALLAAVLPAHAAGPAGPGGPGGKEETPFEEAIKDHRRVDGLFTLYEKDGRWLMALKPDQLDHDYMVAVTRETGIGERGLLAVQVLGEIPVRFQKVGRKVQLLLRNVRFAAESSDEVRRAVDKSFSDSLAGAAKIESAPHPESRAILVDMAPFFLTDVEGIGMRLAQAAQAPYSLDRENSSIASAKSLPMNLELSARLHFAGGKPAPFDNLPDPRSFFITYRYSLSQVPEAPGFMPRIADDRVGHFLALYEDFSDDRKESPYVRYVTRWDLQKDQPYAALSKPVEPITFWLENSIPKKYRKAMADGILMWNKAFERIGFKDAIVVKEQPDDADWDPADVRYATVRWFAATDAAFAIGPSRVNPRTGQIYDADISWAEAIIAGKHREFEELADPVTALNAAFAESYDPRGFGAADSPFLPAFGPPDPRFGCRLARGASGQIAFGQDLLEARGVAPGTAGSDAYVNGFITYVMAHEAGHSLGFRHNFRSSVVHGLAELADASLTGERGMVGSVMDYVPVNLASPGGRQGEYWPSTLGPYDYWAVEYAYRPFPGVKTPEDELPELRRIAARVAEKELSYGTDEDGTEPRTNVWDLGSDPVAFFTGRADVVAELWNDIPGRLGREGEGYQVMRRAFNRGMGQFAGAVGSVAKSIGGIYTHRDHVGDPAGRLPFQPVPAASQRAALDFLRRRVFDSAAFDVPADLVNRLALTRWPDFTGALYQIPRQEYPLHDAVLAIQRNALAALFSPVKLDRLVDLERHFAKGEAPFTLSEMFAGLSDSIWSELQAATPARIDSFRRGLQREHLRRMVDLVVRPAEGVPEDAGSMARGGLTALKGKMQKALSSPALDAGTKAHLEESMARIDAALAASMVRPA